MLMADPHGKLIDVGRYFDGAVRRVVAEWRRPNRGADSAVRKLELECGHIQTMNTLIPSTITSSIRAPSTSIDAELLVRIRVDPNRRPARVCTSCREIYVQKRLAGEIRYVGEE